ncbi:kinesin-like protein KIF26A isoform X2 [Scophthalmus maximus]|uniref:kinesin-like protein KIF26A isoform X2 n=1 Tax=Scophthalmus maximus TaxID=52904 RepID=UPI001FA8ED44|nr:kinesin-like protein KIF26A isoform X2 [Scophthalmus maximus]
MCFYSGGRVSCLNLFPVWLQVVEGDAALPLDSTCRRKRLRSVGEDEDVVAAARRSCASRPNPEGSLSAGEISRYGKEEEGEGPEEEPGEELQRLCQRCHIMTSQLNRQAAALADASALKDPAYASFLFDKLQRLQWPRRGRHAPADARCHVCDASFQQLRRCALRRALGVSREMVPRPVAPPAASSCQEGDELPAKQQRWSSEDQRLGGGALWGWGGVHSTYLGGGGAKGLATVTPLPLNAHHYLEGVWRVSCCGPENRHTTTHLCRQRDCGDHVTTKSSTHSIAIQTSPPPSAAAAFFIRAAQRLSLSRRRRSHPGPASSSSSPPQAPGPLLYTGGFSGALRLLPPAIPPCLLRAGSKIKDTPGMGKVRVMVRICPVDSGESASFLKVDSRKKQLSVMETSSGGRRHSSAKTFSFDAVFPRDSSQAEVCACSVAEVVQSVVNGADGCIFCFGHTNLGKTYTMIGRDCSTQTLGVAPSAISWLFRVMEQRKEKTGACFCVSVSAVEISGREETLSDLLAGVSSPSGGHQGVPGPAVSLREDPVCGSQLQNQTELRVSSAEQAAFYLDAALAARRTSRAPSDLEARRNSHFLFTLHLYRERPDPSNKAAVSGRSRLHLLDLGSCETDISRTREGGGAQCLSRSALGHVVLALANGAKHIPYRDRKLTMLLSESLGNINCWTTMIAHVSDSPVNYMETLTTVQLAARIHRTRKKSSKYTSSSGESSCEEGPSRRPPKLRPFHTRTLAVDPDTPLLLSSEPDYSSNSFFVPIIPSLNKKQIKGAPRSDGDHLKCNTFAELQERLDCIDGSEGPVTCSTDGKAAHAAAFRTQTVASKTPEVTSPPKSEKNSLGSITATCTSKPDQEESKLSSVGGPLDTSKQTSADREKFCVTPFQPCVVQPGVTEPVVQERIYLKGGVPKPYASPSLPRTSREVYQPGEVVGKTPPVGMSQQAPSMEMAPHTSRCPMEAKNLWAVLSGRFLDSEFLRTTVTLQQLVELNGADELVFTVVEEPPYGLVPDNGRPSNLLSFNSDGSLQASVSGSRPVSIISSINDEYDSYTSHQGAEGTAADFDKSCQNMSVSKRGNKPSPVGSWPSEVSSDSAESESTHSSCTLHLRDKKMATGNASTLTSPSTFHRQQFLQHGVESSLNDSGVCFSELDSDPATPNKHSLTRSPRSPDTTKVSLKGFLKVQTDSVNRSLSGQIPLQTSHASLPRKTKPTSSAGVGCSRHEDFLLQGSSHFDPREVEFLTAGEPSRSVMSGGTSKRLGGNSNTSSRPPKAQGLSSAQRVVDGCEESSSRRGDTLIKLPRLNRGSTTLGTVSIRQSSESKWGRETTSVTGTLRFASLGKKSNGQKSSTIPKCGSENISPPTQLVRQSSQEQKTRTAPSPGTLKTSSDIEKSSFPKTSTSVEEFNVRLRVESFSHRTLTLQTDHSGARTFSSLKTRGAKADSSRFYGSVMSLERCDSQAFVGSKSDLFRESSGAAAGGNRSNRSVPSLGVPTSTSTSASSQVSPGVLGTTSKLGQVQSSSSSSSRAAVSGGSKVGTLSAASSKSLSSSPKPPDNAAGRKISLHPTGKSPARSGTGAKLGRGTVMGTKQAISRAANSRVKELAAGGPRKQLSRGPGLTGSEGIDTGTSSVSGSPVNTPIPSPYSKITAPRRPQRYSSGHGSDNSSVLSGELPPAMGRTALFYHSGGSSGYESMMRDSETTGSTSSAHDSMSESGGSSSTMSRVSKSPKKRGNGFLRRRLIPAPLPDSSPLGQWAELAPLGGLKETFEIKVYEIDVMELMQRRRSEGLIHFNTRLKTSERRQQLIRDLRSKHDALKVELDEAKSRLMLRPHRWSGEFDVDQNRDHESQDYLEALVQATAELENRVDLCKSRVMMETCFDIAVTTAAASHGGQREA